MIKVICSDIDGTLIPYGKNVISDRMLSQIVRLKEKGIIFCPTSGRQINSMKKLFREWSKDCYFICENGAVVFDGNDRILGSTPMDRKIATQAAWDFWNNTDGYGEVMLSGKATSYMMCRDLTPEERNYNYNMAQRVRDNGNYGVIINSPDDIEEDIMKVSVFIARGVKDYADRFIDKWKDINCAIAGPYWIDTMQANKGTGIETLCRTLGIDKSEIAAFGDNYNDVPMLDAVGMPFIMHNAHDELKNKYHNIVASCPEDVIEEMFLK